MSYIKRALENILNRATGNELVFVITGAGLIGKTEMIRKIIAEGPERKYVSLDDLRMRQFAKTDPELFLKTYEPPVCIDEAHYAPELFPYIRAYIEKHKNGYTYGAYWLVGSQPIKLFDDERPIIGITPFKVNRIGYLHMTPLSQSEIVDIESKPFFDIKPFGEYIKNKAEPNSIDLFLNNRVKQVKPILESELYRRIWQGGMPMFISGSCADHTEFYNPYLSIFLNHDFRELSGCTDTLLFYNFLKAVAENASKIINFKIIADKCGIDQIKAKQWIDILGKLGIIFQLKAYECATEKRLIKAPKLYFYDCGLVAYLSNQINAETLKDSDLSGVFFENYVVSEIMKSWQNAGKVPPISYYRNKDRKEISLLFEFDDILYPIAITQNPKPDKSFIKSFNTIEKMGKIQGNGAVVCPAISLEKLNENNWVIPVCLI